MSSLTAAKSGSIERVPADLSGKLQWLCLFGKPNIHRHEGWSANIAMNTNSTGSEFKVRSEFGHTTVDAAVDEMISRMLEAIAALGTPTPTEAADHD